MILKPTYYNPSQDNINSLIVYLYSLSGRKLSVSFIRQNIFKTKNLAKNYELITRCHLQAAAIYLNHLIINVVPSDYEESVQTTIAEIIPAIRELDQEEDSSFILIATNTLPSSLHYNHAKWIFYKNTLPPEAKRRYEVDILVLYALRLSLEKRILGFLGIESIFSKRKPVSLSRLLPIVVKLKNVKYNSKIKWDEIIIVNDFLNYFMHRHIRPYPWSIHQVFEVLNPFLLPGKITEKNVIYGSIHSSTFVHDESRLQAEIEFRFREEFSDLKIKWLHHRDILLAKRNGRLENI
jgi:hypothetical protein